MLPNWLIRRRVPRKKNFKDGRSIRRCTRLKFNLFLLFPSLSFSSLLCSFLFFSQRDGSMDVLCSLFSSLLISSLPLPTPPHPALENVLDLLLSSSFSSCWVFMSIRYAESHRIDEQLEKTTDSHSSSRSRRLSVVYCVYDDTCDVMWWLM